MDEKQLLKMEDSISEIKTLIESMCTVSLLILDVIDHSNFAWNKSLVYCFYILLSEAEEKLRECFEMFGHNNKM